MKPEWNTPPNGDFASYVERLSAQSGLPRPQHLEGAHGLDVGMTPQSELRAAGSTGGAAATVAQRPISSNGNVSPGASTSQPGAVVGKVVSAIGFFALLLMWRAGVPIALLLVLFAGGIWIAFKVRRLRLPEGAAQWQKMLMNAAQTQRQEPRQVKQPGRSE